MCLGQAARRNLSHRPASFYCHSTGPRGRRYHPLHSRWPLRASLRANEFFLFVQQQDVGDESPQWKESYLDVMDARLQAALSLVVPQEQGQCTPAPEPGPGGRGSSSLSKDAVPLHNGWRLLAEKDGWRPCPVGIYIGSK